MGLMTTTDIINEYKPILHPDSIVYYGLPTNIAEHRWRLGDWRRFTNDDTYRSIRSIATPSGPEIVFNLKS